MDPGVKKNTGATSRSAEVWPRTADHHPAVSREMSLISTSTLNTESMGRMGAADAAGANRAKSGSNAPTPIDAPSVHGASVHSNSAKRIKET